MHQLARIGTQDRMAKMFANVKIIKQFLILISPDIEPIACIRPKSNGLKIKSITYRLNGIDPRLIHQRRRFVRGNFFDVGLVDVHVSQ